MPATPYENRKKRLATLIAEAGTQDAVAEQIGVTPAYVSHLVTGRRKIGEKMARKIEDATGKPHGWMDATDDQSSEIRLLLAELAGRDQEELSRILALLRAYLKA